MTNSFVDLSRYSSPLDRGRPFFIECLWRIVSALLFQSSWFPNYGAKRFLLRLFGAEVGVGVLIKPRVTITFPWRLTIDQYAWIGEGTWLDSLDHIRIGESACVSQNSYLCTGNHDAHSKEFGLRTAPIEIGRGAWVAAGAIVGPGVRMGEGAMLSLGSVATGHLEPNGIYRGNPAQKIGTRRL